MENEFLKIKILPASGARPQMAVDKTDGNNFIYHNKVIKPALVGQAGSWISRGIEFNWPEHYGPSTFENADYSIAINPGGGKQYA